MEIHFDTNIQQYQIDFNLFIYSKQKHERRNGNLSCALRVLVDAWSISQSSKMFLQQGMGVGVVLTPTGLLLYSRVSIRCLEDDIIVLRVVGIHHVGLVCVAGLTTLAM